MNETTIRPPAAITSAKVVVDLGLVLITGITITIVWRLSVILLGVARSTCGLLDVVEPILLNTRKSTRADIERQKQEEIANARVRQVDSQGRAYGTGKRKCSIARVWIEPGEGKFLINDNQSDIYFLMLDQRAALLHRLTETKTLGLLDINCQIGAICLGMSRALQNWAPDQFRPPLKEAGFLTRDSRIVERKKPGKAKARKSFQWVKR
ncbi:28S ribosomal protein S9, mitochondrial [Tanacetum coccineum]